MSEDRDIVLIVDDDEGVSRLQRRRLERAGFEVRTAATAQAAMEQLHAGGVQVLVLDYRLSETNGLEFYEAMKRAGCDLPTIMVTGYSQESTVVGALRAGVRDFVTKSPDHLEYLVQAVTRLVRQTRTERALRETQERLQLAVWGSNDGLGDWGYETGDCYWSPRLKEMLGYRDDELENTAEAILSRIHPDDLEHVVHEVNEGARLMQPVKFEFRLLTKSGEYRWFQGRARALYDEYGKPYRFAGALTDISERKLMEEELVRRSEQLRQSQKLEVIGALAGGIAHEFNNLLQVIRGYTKYGMEGLSPAEQRYLDLDQVFKAADRATALTRQLLGFSRRQVLERAMCDPRVVLTDLVKLLRPVIGEQIELDVSPARDASHVYADRGLLEQMLLNLCINSRDAMPDGGRLVLKTERVEISKRYCELHPTARPGSYVLFSVADTGHGMPLEVQARIFEPFFTTKEVGHGTGLGLAMVYGVVQQHEGFIYVYSEVGLGTTFKIYLPISRQAEAMPIHQEPGSATGGCETILLAEDEAIVRDLAVRMLRGAGYSVLTAADGAEAIDLFQSHSDRIHLALIDAVMPKLTGHDVYERLKLLNPKLPIIFCSGYDPDMGQIKSLSDRGLKIVAKPYDPDVLLGTVRAALDAQSQPRRILSHAQARPTARTIT